MTSILKRQVGPYTISLYIGKQTNVTGINSTLRDGQHIIMWEFDEKEPHNMTAQLMLAQQTHCLSDIHIARSSESGGFHAYCFTAVPWIYSIHVVSGTGGVDPGYISMCAMRGHWTLRTSDKGNGAPTHWMTLPSGLPPDCDKNDLAGGVNYKVWERKSRPTSITVRCATCGYPTPLPTVPSVLAGIPAHSAESTAYVGSLLFGNTHDLTFDGNEGICPLCLNAWMPERERVP